MMTRIAGFAANLIPEEEIEQIDERAKSMLTTALRCARRLARPGQEITVAHWWSVGGSEPQGVAVRVIA